MGESPIALFKKQRVTSIQARYTKQKTTHKRWRGSERPGLKYAEALQPSLPQAFCVEALPFTCGGIMESTIA
ncbi:hypothetical protein J6590_018062 [Homalodisca vitripennis]|nr:hypothetical protein J6590_018062 [Homalodisca vitripennis]